VDPAVLQRACARVLVGRDVLFTKHQRFTCSFELPKPSELFAVPEPSELSPGERNRNAVFSSLTPSPSSPRLMVLRIPLPSYVNFIPSSLRWHTMARNGKGQNVRQLGEEPP